MTMTMASNHPDTSSTTNGDDSWKKREVEDYNDNDGNSSNSDYDPLQDLERFVSNDTIRLNLKWEHKTQQQKLHNHSEDEADSNRSCFSSKIIVGTNTYLPLCGRGLFSLEIPQKAPQQSTPLSPKDDGQWQQRCACSSSSARGLLFRLVSKIVFLSPSIRELDIEGFGCRRSKSTRGGDLKGSTPTPILDIEDVFEAFAREEFSPWRRGVLKVVRTWDCDMNSHFGNHFFRLADHEYPKGLEEVYVHNPKGSILSSTIFKISSRSPNLSRFYVFHGYDEADEDEDEYEDSDDDDAAAAINDNNNYGHGRRTNISDNNNSKLHQFNGSRLTKSSINAICEVLSSANQLLEMNQLPFREFIQLPEADFCKILAATTTTTSPRHRDNESRILKSNLRFPVARNAAGNRGTKKPVSKLTILATRSDALRFYLLRKRSLEVLRDTEKRGLAPLVLEKCQKRKSILQWIPCSQIDLLFAMLQDSLETVLTKAPATGHFAEQQRREQK